MTIQHLPFWQGVLCAPLIYMAVAFLLHRGILMYRWAKKVAKGHAINQWPSLWAVSWGLPRLTKDYCHFKVMDGRTWFSPRMEKFRVFKTPEDLGQ